MQACVLENGIWGENVCVRPPPFLRCGEIENYDVVSPLLETSLVQRLALRLRVLNSATLCIYFICQPIILLISREHFDVEVEVVSMLLQSQEDDI